MGEIHETMGVMDGVTAAETSLDAFHGLNPPHFNETLVSPSDDMDGAKEIEGDYHNFKADDDDDDNDDFGDFNDAAEHMDEKQHDLVPNNVETVTEDHVMVDEFTPPIPATEFVNTRLDDKNMDKIDNGDDLWNGDAVTFKESDISKQDFNGDTTHHNNNATNSPMAELEMGNVDINIANDDHSTSNVVPMNKIETIPSPEMMDSENSNDDFNALNDAVDLSTVKYAGDNEPKIEDQDDDDDFGDFDTATTPMDDAISTPSVSVNVTRNDDNDNLGQIALTAIEDNHNDDDEFGDFGAAEVLPVMTTTTSSQPIPVNGDDDNDFGEFDAAEPMYEMPTPAAHENVAMNEENDDFGHFDSATVSANHDIVMENINDDDDDFGDFDTAETSPVIATSNEPIPDNDDDDDFGDFDEAPVSVATDNETVDKSTVPPTTDRISGMDPIVAKVRHTFPEIFIRYAREESTAVANGNSNSIPQFHEDEIITIESVLVRCIEAHAAIV
jgi:hypothetical protein